MREGKLVFFDGNDGTGKSSNLKTVHSRLVDDEYAVYINRIHGGAPFGEALRPISLDPDLERPPESDLYVSAAMHWALAPVLKAEREQGKICLIDRSPLSMTAYQVHGDGMDSEEGRRMVDKEMDLFQPDLVIIYDAPPEVSLPRAIEASKGKRDYFESKGPVFFERTREGYLQDAERYGATVIDTVQSRNIVIRLTMEAMHSVLHNR